MEHALYVPGAPCRDDDHVPPGSVQTGNGRRQEGIGPHVAEHRLKRLRISGRIVEVTLHRLEMSPFTIPPFLEKIRCFPWQVSLNEQGKEVCLRDRAIEIGNQSK